MFVYKFDTLTMGNGYMVWKRESLGLNMVWMMDMDECGDKAKWISSRYIWRGIIRSQMIMVDIWTKNERSSHRIWSKVGGFVAHFHCMVWKCWMCVCVCVLVCVLDKLARPMWIACPLPLLMRSLSHPAEGH